MPIGFQDPWLAGSRFLWKRETAGGAQYPLIDFGDIEPVSPVVTKTEIEALVSDSGRIKTRDRRLVRFVESYQIQTRNLRQQTLAVIFLSTPPSAISQSAETEKVVTGIKVFKGELVALTADAAGLSLQYPEAISGLYTGAVTTATLTAISRANRTLTVTGDITAALTPGDSIIVDRTGLANIRNCRSYTMVSDSFGGGSTTVVVAETPASDETAITGQVVYENGGTIWNQGIDWIPYRHPSMGLVKIMPAGNMTDLATDVSFRYSVPARSGNVIVKPKSLTNEARGKGYIVWSRAGDSEKTYREFNCVLSPQGMAVPGDNYGSATLNVEVIGNPSNVDEPYGRLLQAIGSPPEAA